MQTSWAQASTTLTERDGIPPAEAAAMRAGMAAAAAVAEESGREGYLRNGAVSNTSSAEWLGGAMAGWGRGGSGGLASGARGGGWGGEHWSPF